EARAQGFEQQQQIKATADRERTVLIAEAQREAQVLRGQGDEQAIRILAESYGRDAEFFAFYRTLQAYRTTFGDKSTTMVLTPEGEFFRYFNPQPSGPGAEVPNAPPAASAATPAANP
ncbi:MAG TPA: protease modulator HflC, partial [Alphaproteobacteria bacterium]|nr:protease modulator HflC [Alphaproteobacteria bacterium]